MPIVETERIEDLIASIIELAPPEGRIRAIVRQRVERLVALARVTPDTPDTGEDEE